MIPCKITTKSLFTLAVGNVLKTKRVNIIPHLTRCVYCNVNKR